MRCPKCSSSAYRKYGIVTLQIALDSQGYTVQQGTDGIKPKQVVWECDDCGYASPVEADNGQ